MTALVDFLERLAPALKSCVLKCDEHDQAVLRGIISDAEYWADWARERSGSEVNYRDMRQVGDDD